MQMARRKTRVTYQDYIHIPGEKRYEIIDGDLHMVPAPFTQHQQISARLFQILAEFVQDRSLGEVFYAPVDVILSEEDVLQPDLLFISRARLGILTSANVRGAPDLVVEILSPSTKQWDLQPKRRLYEKYGVREYWIVDPDAQSVEVLTLTDDGFQTVRVFTKGTHVKSPLLEGFAPAVDAIFPPPLG